MHYGRISCLLSIKGLLWLSLIAKLIYPSHFKIPWVSECEKSAKCKNRCRVTSRQPHDRPVRTAPPCHPRGRVQSGVATPSELPTPVHRFLTAIYRFPYRSHSCRHCVAAAAAACCCCLSLAHVAVC